MRPFEGIRIIDITHVLAGPFAAYQLGLMGADVIKVEHPDDPDQSPRFRQRQRPQPRRHGHRLPHARLQQARHHAEPEDRTGPRHPAQAGRHRRCAGGKLPPRRVRGTGPRLRGPEEDQPEADLRLVLRVRPDRAEAGAHRLRPRDPVDLRHHGDDRHAGGEPDQDRRPGDRLRHRHDGCLSPCPPRCSSGSGPARASASTWRCWTSP